MMQCIGWKSSSLEFSLTSCHQDRSEMGWTDERRGWGHGCSRHSKPKYCHSHGKYSFHDHVLSPFPALFSLFTILFLLNDQISKPANPKRPSPDPICQVQINHKSKTPNNADHALLLFSLISLRFLFPSTLLSSPLRLLLSSQHNTPTSPPFTPVTVLHSHCSSPART